MNQLINLLNNKILIISALSWFVAGVLKVIIELIVNKEFNLTRIFGAGGMPSSHTATVVSLSITIGYICGLSSVEFALSIIFTIIVIHDAVGVRQETGKQAKILNQMIFDTNIFTDFDLEKQLKEYIGHTPFQVLMGALVGTIVSIISIKAFY